MNRKRISGGIGSMKKKTVRKRILIGVFVIASLAFLYIGAVGAQGVTLQYWSKLDYPNAIEIFFCNIDEYPGHSLECLRFPYKLMEDAKGKQLEYTEKGLGIDINNYSIHIGDSREHVKNEFYYSDPEGTGSRYELGCFFCDPDSWLTFSFSYDENDILTKMTIRKGMMLGGIALKNLIGMEYLNGY